MKLKEFDIIKHDAFMDVAVVLTADPMPTKDGGLEIKGLWMNQGFTKSWIINPIREYGRLRHVIKPGDLKRWSKCMTPGAKCVRNEPWEPIV